MQVEMVRGWQYAQMENNIQSIERIIRMSDPEALTTFRDNGNGWTALEVLCHLRDFEQIFLQRFRVTVEQDNPPLPFPNPDEMAAEQAYNVQNPDAVLAQWKANRTELLAYLRERSESDWERPAMHPKRGALSLLDQLFLTSQHDPIHLEQMTRTLYEKKLS